MSNSSQQAARLFIIDPGVEVAGVVVDFDKHGYHLHVFGGTRLPQGRYTIPLHNVGYVAWEEPHE